MVLLFQGTDHYAEGKVAGAFVDLRTKRILFTTEVSDTVAKSKPTFLSSYGRSDLFIAKLRRKLILDMGDELSKKVAAL